MTRTLALILAPAFILGIAAALAYALVFTPDLGGFMQCTCDDTRNRDCRRHGDDRNVRTYVIGDDARVTILTDGSLLLTTERGRERAVLEFATLRDSMDFVREAGEAMAWKWTVVEMAE